MTDEGKASVVICLWTIAFNAGVLIAASFSKAIGLTLMACSTIVLVTYLAADGRVEAERKRRKRYQADCARRAQQEHERWRND